MTERTCDVAIIGAGTAGLAAERSARGAGAKTLLIDEDFAGTTCARIGCMPSKLLIAAGNAAHAVRTADVFGIDASAPRIDGAAVMARVRRERDAFVASTCQSVHELPGGIAVKARARFTGPATLALDDGSSVTARAVVIATGARPMIPEAFKSLGDLILTNETIFEMATLPPSVAVIGAGSVGLELAQALTRLGVEVAVFDKAERIVGMSDEAVAECLTTLLRREFPIRLGVEVEAERDADGGGAIVRWSDGRPGGEAGEHRFARVLIASGRPPALDGLDLETTGLALSDKGVPEYDFHTLQCGSAPVFIAGDVDDDRAVLHEASNEGAIAGGNAARYPEVRKAERGAAFRVMFTDPPLAVVGEPADEETVTGEASYADQGRAKIEARGAGLVRLYARRGDGRLTGATLAAPGMDHIAHLIAWSIERGETASKLLERPFYHPTLEEGLKGALREICAAVNSPLPKNRDEGDPPGA